MGRNSYFKFKQFTVQNEKSAMKVGTDGVLLGAWVNAEKCNTILDVGTGTGVIAIMMAQRTSAKVTGIEIEEDAAIEAAQNAFDSPWSKRIDIHHVSLQEFSKHKPAIFDLIVSNPPFFDNAYKAGSKNRTLARHNDSLPFSDLLSCSSDLLSNDGRLAVILPLEEGEVLEKLAIAYGLFLARKTEVKPKLQKVANRVLLEFCTKETVCKKDMLIIYNENGGYTDEYKTSTKDFYLKH